MAIVQTNSMTKGISGAIGNLVFRQLRGKTIITSKPKQRAKQSDQQRNNRSRFRSASAWAKTQMLDPQKKAYYWRKAEKLKLPNAYTAAVSDYMRKGEIKEIDTRWYKGKKGNVIRLKIQKHDFSIHQVKVVLRDAHGNVIESNMAIKKEQNIFLYKVTRTVESKIPVTICVMVMDHLDNIVTRELKVIV
jgi:hypothetical protein